MARNDEDYDFFGDGQYDDSRSSRRAQNRRPSRRNAGRRFAATKASSPTSMLCRRLAVVSGLLAVVVSATSAVHEIAPYAISFMTAVPGRYIALTAAVLISITLILVIAARVTMPRYATHGGVGAGGIIALVCAVVCLVIGVAIGLPGITTVQMCTDPRVAFVSFESESSAAISRAPIESKISELLSQYADNEQTKGDWRLLSGKRWMVFGEASKMTALQQQWGGELETITAAANSGNA
ncbi:MAG: hypothetical protein KHX19_06010 [Bifidobacterium longum]|nr:hypothetical protein [Bifidobacterium longum]